MSFDLNRMLLVSLQELRNYEVCIYYVFYKIFIGLHVCHLTQIGLQYCEY